MSWEDINKAFEVDRDTRKAESETGNSQQQTSKRSLQIFPSIRCMLTTVPEEGERSQEKNQVDTVPKSMTDSHPENMEDSWDESEDFVQQLITKMSQYEVQPPESHETENCATGTTETDDTSPIPSKRMRMEVTPSNVLTAVATPQSNIPLPVSKMIQEEKDAASAGAHSSLKRKCPDKDVQIVDSKSGDLEVLPSKLIKEDIKSIKSMTLNSRTPIHGFPRMAVTTGLDGGTAVYNMTNAFAHFINPLQQTDNLSLLDHPRFQKIVQDKAAATTVQEFQLCFEAAIDLCVELLVPLISELKAPRPYCKKDYATVAINWKEEPITSQRPWFENEICPLLRRSLALVLDIVTSQTEKCMQQKVLQVLETGPGKGAILDIEKLAYFCAQIDDNLSQPHSALTKTAVFLGKLKETIKPRVPLSGLYSTVDSDNRYSSDYDMIHPESPSSSGSPAVEHQSPMASTSSSTKHMWFPIVSSSWSCLYSKSSYSHPNLSQEEPRESKVEEKEDSAISQFVDLLYKTVDVAVTHPEAHLLEGILCAILQLIDVLHSDVAIGEEWMLCKILCKSFELTLSPTLLFCIMRTGSRIGINNPMVFNALCRLWEDKSLYKCPVQKIASVVAYILGEETQLPKDVAFYTPHQSGPPEGYASDLLYLALQWVNTELMANHSLELTMTCHCFKKFLPLALKHTFLRFRNNDSKLQWGDQHEPLALHILYQLCCTATRLQNILGELYLDAGDFVSNLLKCKEREDVTAVHVTWGKEILQEYEWPYVNPQQPQEVQRMMRTLADWRSPATDDDSDDSEQP